jgi:uncharacterized membrane protein (Fun14 family)
MKSVGVGWAARETLVLMNFLVGKFILSLAVPQKSFNFEQLNPTLKSAQCHVQISEISRLISK